MHRRFTAALLLAFVLIVPVAGNLHAQAENVRSVTFAAGFREDHVLYYLPDVVPTDSVEAEIVVTALAHAASVYQPLFVNATGQSDVIPFQIVAELLPYEAPVAVDPSVTPDPNAPPSPNWTIAATGMRPSSQVDFASVVPPAAPLDAEVCRIRVYEVLLRTRGPLAALAHELAHCYQDHFVHDTNADPLTDWWTEGSADWLAYDLAYPEYAPHNYARITFNYTNPILTRSYDNFYFFEFLASPRGLGSVQAAIDFLVSIPEDPSQHAEALNAASLNISGADLMQRWALSIYNQDLRVPPPFDLSTVTPINGAARRSQTLSGERFSVGMTRINNFNLEPDQQLSLIVTGTAVSNYRVSLVNGASAPIELTDGAALVFCPDVSGITLIRSRGLADAGDRTPLTVAWEPVPSDTPCQTTSDPAECLYGTWQVVTYPPIQGSEAAAPGMFVWDTSNFIFRFFENGELKGNFEVTYSVPSDGNTQVRAVSAFSGVINAEPIAEGSTTFNVRAFSWDLTPGGSATLRTAGGQVGDFTQAFYSTMPVTSAWSPNGTLECDGDTITWTTANVEGYFELVRVD